MDLNKTSQPGGSVVMDTSTGFPPPPPPPQAPVRETVVVPPQGVGGQPAGNPYIPQGFTPAVPDPGQSKGRSGGFMRGFLRVFIVLAIIGLAIGGGWYVLQNKSIVSREVTITYWGLWEDENIIAPLIADFEAKFPKIKVLYVKQSHRLYRERLEYAINNEEGPDAFRYHNTWIAMLREELSSVPDEVMSPSEFSSTFYPVASTNLVAGSTIYGLPLMVDGLGLYINEDLFASKNVQPPTTWEEVLNLVPVLTEKVESTITQSAIALGTTNNVENFSDIVALMFFQNGADLVRPTGTEAEETLIFYKKFSDPNDEYYTWNETLDNSIYAFTTGRVAMILAPSWRAHEIHENNQNLNFRIVPVPQLPGGTVTWASYWVEGVSAKSPYQQQAWEFVKYMTSREGATQLYTEESKTRLFGEPYARTDLADSIKNDPYAGAFIAMAPDAKSFPVASRTFDNGINDQLIKYLENALNATRNGASPTEALDTAASGFNQILARYGLVSATAPESQ